MSAETPAATGIPGLDDVLAGGLTRDRIYLVEGSPGAGKTTLAVQFLLEGLARGEAVLYITLAETETELRDIAASHDWNLDGLTICELVTEERLDAEQEQTIFYPSEVELGEAIAGIVRKVEQAAPARMVLDSLSELRLLAQNPLRYRRQILALKHYFAKQSCTVLMLDDQTAETSDLQLHSVAHGVISLEQTANDFGAERRRLRVTKYRGVKFRGGYHDFNIERGGLRVYPRLVANEHHRRFLGAPATTGVEGLDLLLGGGLVPGTATLLGGPAGVGKTTTAIRCMLTALQRGEKAAYFLFDEGIGTLMTRSMQLGMDLGPYLDNGQLLLRQVDPAELSPGEFTWAVRAAVEEGGASVVGIDSLNAYLKSMPDGKFLSLQMHELLSYLNQLGVTTLLILGYHGVIGSLKVDVDLSYLADSIIFMRFFEADGEVRKAISVVKTRTSAHERTIREFRVDRTGLVIGEPLRGFRGVLTGVPDYSGLPQALMDADGASKGG